MGKKIIMLTNDDGIDAGGLSALYKTLKADKRFDIRVIAPDKENSSVGHAITIFRPIPVRKEYRLGSFYGHAVGGTPADCVKLGVWAILDETPDLLISGINRGANVGESIIYSGTISAATEGIICGVPSIAVSIDNHIDPDYSYAASFAKKAAEQVLDNGGLPKGTLLNINIPDVPEEKVKGVKITVQSKAGVKDTFIKRQDPRGMDYYWSDGEFIEETKDINFDSNALKNGFVSITPIHHDMTDYKVMDLFQKWNIEK